LILWDEYIAANPGGYSYSRFCELYRSFEKTVSVTMDAALSQRKRQ
jgi:transposase